MRSCAYIFCVMTALLLGCKKEHKTYPHDTSNEEESVVTVTPNINLDTKTWEDRVTEIRMLAFDQSGNAVYNRPLRYLNGFDKPCEAVNLVPGTYDFYFIANETAYSGDFTAALAALTNVSQFTSDARFAALGYNAGFVPDGTTSGGRFVMSAIYKNVAVAQGGTQTQPITLNISGNVMFVRSLAKVEVIFRKKVSGGNVPQGTIASVGLQNVAGVFSVPPVDGYYTGALAVSNVVEPSAFDYTGDSIGMVVFYIPELLRQNGATQYTEIHINNQIFPVLSDAGMAGLATQGRTVSSLSTYSVIRNYDYRVNAYVNSEGGVEIETSVVPWKTASYTYMFQDDGKQFVLPPITETPGGVIIPTSCGTVEMKIQSENELLTSGLQGAYGDQIEWYNPSTGGSDIIHGTPPYYCEQKYGEGWRLINSCELMSFLALFDQTYKVWQSNTWLGINAKLPFYSASFRMQAQSLLEKLTGEDLSQYTPSDSTVDSYGGVTLDIIDKYFTPGDVMPTLDDYPDGWPYPSPPQAGIQSWMPMETITQVKAFYYSDYLDYSDPANYDKILYQQFTAYSFSSTVSRCVRAVD